MGKKYSKNLSKVQSMVDGTYGHKIQSGYTPDAEPIRKVGDVWTDSDDVQWEQMNGYKSKITKTVNVGIFTYQCSDCKKGLSKSTIIHDNNPKFKNKHKKSLLSYFTPEPHGACDSNIKELFFWRKKRWIKALELEGFKVVKIIKLPVTTGYGFKLEKLCEIMYKIGFCSSYAYIAVKNEESKTIKYFI